MDLKFIMESLKLLKEIKGVKLVKFLEEIALVGTVIVKIKG